MKAIIASAAALMALGTFGPGPASAEQNEIISIINTAENDSQFGMFSYRRSFGASLDAGLSFRIDASRGRFDVPGSTGTIDTLHLLLGYRMVMDPNTDLTFYGGVSVRKRDYTVVLPGYDEFNETGAFGSVEINSDFADGGEIFGLVEYDTTKDVFYTSAFYQADLGGVKIGPTVNFLEEGDYQRRAAGLRVTYPVSDRLDITATGAWAEGDTGGPAVNSSYFELQLRTSF
ncbi:MAG: hypothetical protein WAT25_03255 [Paracoccaceae bacterium]